MPDISFRASAIAAPCMLLCASFALAAPPAVTDVDLRGLQIGGTTNITITGTSLGADSRLLVPGLALQQSVVESPGTDASQQLTMSVQVDPNAKPGIYPVWVVNPRGISNPTAVSVDALPQLAFREQIDALPVALHGRLQGESILTTKFAGRAGMHLVVEVQSRRLGANTKAVIRLLDARGAQVEWSEGIDRLTGDARLAVVLPADETYTLQVHDVLYRGEAPGHFVIKMGELTYADMAFPLAVQRGQSADFQLLQGNLTGTTVSASASSDWLLRFLPVIPASPLFTGSAPRVVVSEHPEVAEPPSTGMPSPLPAVPVGVSGRLQAAKEEDRYTLPVQPGTTLRFEVFAERVGSPLDSVLLIRDAAGNELARGDDQPGTPDSALDFAVPANVQEIVLSVSDLLKRGGDEFVYRLQVRDAARPQFNLSLDTDRVTIPAGATQLVRVNAQRLGYGGPVALTLEGLPADVQVSGQSIPPGVDSALVVLKASATAVPPTFVRVLGQAAAGDAPHQTLALVPDTFRAESYSWTRQYLAVGSGEAAPIQLALNADTTQPIARGSKIALPFTITRAPGTMGKARIRMISTQPMPKKKVNENGVEKEVDDVERALRLEADVIVDAAASDGTAQLLVPGDLPENMWSIVLVGELLGPDDTTVVSTTYSDSRTLTFTAPLRVDLASAANIEAKAGLGETGKFTGKVIRSAGFDQPVTVTLAGLPSEYPPPALPVAAGQEDFELSVAFPYGLAAAELKNVQLVAETSAPAGGVVRSAGVPVEIKVIPGEKPPVEPPLAIFEDEEAFASQLSKGNGQIAIESATKYSGQASVKVTPDQRFNEQLPMLGVRIRENPGPGEYRYLRFAWRKSGGQAVCVQLNHDGAWGAGGTGRAGATFRYHAGPVPEVYGGSMSVDQNLPAEFVVVTRDLFADFGEFTFNGIALSAVDGEYALFDHIYLGRSLADFESVMPK